jgi:hypothetical protein
MKKAYDFSKWKERKNPYVGKEKAVGINWSPQVAFLRSFSLTTQLRVCYVIPVK